VINEAVSTGIISDTTGKLNVMLLIMFWDVSVLQYNIQIVLLFIRPWLRRQKEKGRTCDGGMDPHASMPTSQYNTGFRVQQRVHELASKFYKLASRTGLRTPVHQCHQISRGLQTSP
jgi:hypothetical protein